MRIVQVANWYIPEYGYQEYFLADAWQRMGHDVLTIAGTQVYPRQGYHKVDGLHRNRKVAPGRYDEHGTPVLRLPALELRIRTLLSPRLESLVREVEPDIVVVHGLATFNSVRMARLKRKTSKPFRLVCDDHMISANTQGGLLGRAFYRAVRRFVTPALLNTVDAFVPISEETREILLQRCGVPNDRMTVIPLGVDVERFRRSGEERRAVRGELGVQPDDILVVYAGKLAESKRTDALVSTAVPVLRRHPKVRLLVIGSGEAGFVARHQRHFQEAGLDSRVTWLPLQPNAELPHFFSAADIGIWPGTESMVILEAAACEVPVICRRSPYHEERFGNGEAMLFRDFGEMQQHLDRLITEPELRRSLGARAREAVTRFGWDGVAERFLRV